MTKKSFLDATKGLFNTVREYNGLYIRRRGWDKNSWQLVDSMDFDKAKIINEFYLREELWDYLKQLDQSMQDDIQEDTTSMEEKLTALGV